VPSSSEMEHLRDAGAAPRHGDAQAALVAAREACLAAPNMAEAHYAFGQAWIAAGQPSRAEQAFATAIRLRPNFADAWVNLGLARYSQGAVEHARRAMLGALQAHPGHQAATTNLAVLLRLTGGYEAAETLLREALARDPRDAGARLNLVAEALQEERPAEALALLRARLLARAAVLGWTRTAEAGLHLLADGRVIPAERDGEDWVFRLDDPADEVWLMSRWYVPAHQADGLADSRRLGVAVASLAVNGRTCDLPAPAEGWHDPEVDLDGRFRWTTGRARLPSARAFRLRLVHPRQYWQRAVKSGSEARGEDPAMAG